jgi:RNA polymerase sigma factor (sigma-70 family)
MIVSMRTPLLHRLAGDDALAARAGAGDDLAFAALVRRVQPRLHGYCAAILANAQDADDAVQNTLIKALAGLRRGERVMAVRPWLYRIAHNEAISLLRRRRPASELVATVADHALGPAETVAVREEMRAVLHAIGELPDRSRDAFLLREVAGMRHAEVAEVLGTSAGNARQAVFEARMALQDDRAGRHASCQSIRAEISGRERRRASRAVRGHLRSCRSCRAWSDAQAERRRILGLAPGVPLAGAGGLWGWLGGLLGGGAATGGATVKIVASVAAVATLAPVGVSTLERRIDHHERPAVTTAREAPRSAPAPTRHAAASAPVVRHTLAATPAPRPVRVAAHAPRSTPVAERLTVERQPRSARKHAPQIAQKVTRPAPAQRTPRARWQRPDRATRPARRGATTVAPAAPAMGRGTKERPARRWARPRIPRPARIAPPRHERPAAQRHHGWGRGAGAAPVAPRHDPRPAWTTPAPARQQRAPAPAQPAAPPSQRGEHARGD